MKTLLIAAGIICDARQQIFITRRRPGSHMADKWEFPGGKLEAGETPAEALIRELWEETGIQVSRWSLFTTQTDYLAGQSCQIRIWFYRVTQWQGTPWGKEGQPFRWLRQDQLSVAEFPPSNAAVVRKSTGRC